MSRSLGILLLVLFAWSNLDRFPPELQFWRASEATIRVQNLSDQDISEVIVWVSSVPQQIGTLKKNAGKDLSIPRRNPILDVGISFRYGTNSIGQHAGTLDGGNGYKMKILTHFAGVVTVEEGPWSEGAQASSR
jgi:hypothetical protein